MVNLGVHVQALYVVAGFFVAVNNIVLLVEEGLGLDGCALQDLVEGEREVGGGRGGHERETASCILCEQPTTFTEK